MSKKIIISLLLLIICSFCCYALKEDFYAYAGSPKLDICQCETISNPISIRNTGGYEEQTVYVIDNGNSTEETEIIKVPSSYVLYQKGTAAKWSALVPETLVLDSGEAGRVENLITAPCSAEGRYGLETVIETQEGLKKVITQDISVAECDNLKINVYGSLAEGCPCSPLRYDFRLRNTGSFTESYYIGVSGEMREYASLTHNPVILTPGGEQEVTLFINMPCGTHGNFEFELEVWAKNNNLFKTEKLMVAINPCYDYTFLTGELVKPAVGGDGEDEAGFSEYAGTYQVCEKGEEQQIPIRITNNAEIRNSYLLELEAEEWAMLEENLLLNLSKGMHAGTYITMNPYAYLSGDYTLRLKVTTMTGGIEKIFEIPVRAEWCYTPLISPELERIRINYSVLSTPIFVKNTGKLDASYRASVDLAWAELSESEISIPAGKGATVELITYPEYGTVEEGVYTATVTLISKENNAAYSRSLKLKLKDDEKAGFELGEAYAFIAGYRYYLIAGAVLLIIVLIALIYLRRKALTEESGGVSDEEKERKGLHERKVGKEEKKEEGKIRERQPAQLSRRPEPERTIEIEVPSWLKWLILLLVIIAAVMALYFMLRRFFDIGSLADNPFWIYAWDTAAVFLAEYRWYIITGILLAAILLAVLSYLSRVRDRDKGEEIKKERAEKRKEKAAELSKAQREKETEAFITERKARTRAAAAAKPAKKETARKTGEKGRFNWWVLLLLLLGIAVLLTAVFYGYTWYKERLPANETAALPPAENATGLQEAPIPEEKVSYEDCLWKWQKNTNSQINLSKMFTDPDGDRLSYSSNQPEHLSIVIDDNGVASLIPERGFSGKVSVQFYADDGSPAGMVSSGKLTFCVTEDGGDAVFGEVWSFISSYRRYLLAGVGLAVLIILLLLFSGPVMRFIEEDSNRKEKAKGRTSGKSRKRKAKPKSSGK